MPAMSEPSNYLQAVRDQYEALPYPACDPQDEHRRLQRTWLEDLAMINHHGHAGRQGFRGGYRVLVAGGGTGDATIFLAEQLRDHGARIVHLDISGSSIAIAQERARIRKLDNITWIHDSMLNAPSLGLGTFDYISCAGVLHHLEDPDAGLRALLAVLAPQGVMGLMVYGAIGRTAVYQMQSLLRMVNEGVTDRQQQIRNARDILERLPPGNWFQRAEGLHKDHRNGDAGLYDLLLHPKDRAYTVGELYDWLCTPASAGGHGLHLVFSDVQRGRTPYQLQVVMGPKPPAVQQALLEQPVRRQQEMAELMIGNLITHSFYLTRGGGQVAPYGDPAYIPFFFHEPMNGESVAKVFAASRGAPFVLTHEHSGMKFMANPGRYGPQILRLIDGQRSFGEIFQQFRAEWTGRATPPDDAALFADFAPVYEALNSLDRLLLRHPQAEQRAG